MNTNESVTVKSLLWRVALCVTIGWAIYDVSAHGRALFAWNTPHQTVRTPLTVALDMPGSPRGTYTPYTPAPAPRWALPATPQSTPPPSFSSDETTLSAVNTRVVSAPALPVPPPSFDLQNRRVVDSTRQSWYRPSPGAASAPLTQQPIIRQAEPPMATSGGGLIPVVGPTPNPYAALKEAAGRARPSSPLDVIGQQTTVIPPPILPGTHP